MGLLMACEAEDQGTFLLDLVVLGDLGLEARDLSLEACHLILGVVHLEEAEHS